MAELDEAGEITRRHQVRPAAASACKTPTGDPEGFDVEIAKLIAAKLGIAEDKIEFIETVSANREPFIQDGKVDIVVATYTINDKRKEVVDFAGPVLRGRAGHHGRKGNPEGIKGPDDLAGKKVCSVEGSTPAENIADNTPRPAGRSTTPTPSAPTT